MNIFNKKKRKKYTSKMTYTKKWMGIIMAVALIDLQLPFILSFMGKDQIAETLGITIVTEIIGVFLVYCAKAFFETRESERIRLQEMSMNPDPDNSNDEIINEEESEDDDILKDIPEGVVNIAACIKNFNSDEIVVNVDKDKEEELDE